MARHYPSIGSVSSGTMRAEDLLEAFAGELEDLVQQNADAWCSDAGHKERDAYLAEVWDARKCDAEENPEVTNELVESLLDALNDFAPDYCYFGSHPGDGADFGFWVIGDVQQQAKDDGTLVVDDTSEIPEEYRGLVLHVNDHGNMALYAVDADGVQSELWSCV